MYLFVLHKHIDSLRTNVLLAKNDHQKLEAVFALCDEANSLNPDTLYKYCALANTLASKSDSKDETTQHNSIVPSLVLSRLLCRFKVQ